MTIQRKQVGLNWLLLGTFPFGGRLRRVEGSYAGWMLSTNKPDAWANGNRVVSDTRFGAVPAGNIWVRGLDGISTLEFDISTQPSVGTNPGEQYFQTEYILNAAAIQAKQITLTPVPISRVRLNVLRGIEQDQDVDYLVDNNGVLSWNGLALETLVESGTKLYISYFIGT